MFPHESFVLFVTLQLSLSCYLLSSSIQKSLFTHSELMKNYVAQYNECESVFPTHLPLNRESRSKPLPHGEDVLAGELPCMCTWMCVQLTGSLVTRTIAKVRALSLGMELWVAPPHNFLPIGTQSYPSSSVFCFWVLKFTLGFLLRRITKAMLRALARNKSHRGQSHRVCIPKMGGRVDILAQIVIPWARMLLTFADLKFGIFPPKLCYRKLSLALKFRGSEKCTLFFPSIQSNLLFILQNALRLSPLLIVLFNVHAY